jgi:hypothetical protein
MVVEPSTSICCANEGTALTFYGVTHQRQYTLFNLLRVHAYVAVEHHLRLLRQRRLHPLAMPVSRR